jgi:putative ABC transport system substrate-binding protein
MKRRECLAVLAALAIPLRALSQQGKMYRIGFLGTSFAAGYVREIEWIRGGLAKLGYVEGRNLAIDYRWAESKPARLKALAAELVALKPDVIVTHSIPGAQAASEATKTIPIVMADGADAIAAGLAVSLARPGGNVTGSMSFVPEESGKRLQLLKEGLPRLKRAAFLHSTLNPKTFTQILKAIHDAAASMQLELQDFVVREPSEIPGAFEAMASARMEGVVVANEPLLNSQAGVIAALAISKRLPSVGYVSFADQGGLIAYGANRAALYGRAGHFVDLILKGARPGDIPIERATRFDLIVNRKTARLLGIALPDSMLLRVDRVIE